MHVSIFVVVCFIGILVAIEGIDNMLFLVFVLYSYGQSCFLKPHTVEQFDACVWVEFALRNVVFHLKATSHDIVSLAPYYRFFPHLFCKIISFGGFLGSICILPTLTQRHIEVAETLFIGQRHIEATGEQAAHSRRRACAVEPRVDEARPARAASWACGLARLRRNRARRFHCHDLAPRLRRGFKVARA